MTKKAGDKRDQGPKRKKGFKNKTGIFVFTSNTFSSFKVIFKVLFLKALQFYHDNKHGENNGRLKQQQQQQQPTDFLTLSIVAWPEEIGENSGRSQGVARKGR